MIKATAARSLTDECTYIKRPDYDKEIEVLAIIAQVEKATDEAISRGRYGTRIEVHDTDIQTITYVAEYIRDHGYQTFMLTKEKNSPSVTLSWAW